MKTDELICPKCGSDEVYYENAMTGSGGYTCQYCEFIGEEQEFCEDKKLLLKVGDKVIGRDNRKGVIEKIHDTGQILVKQSSHVWCTYDHAYMLKKEGE